MKAAASHYEAATAAAMVNNTTAALITRWGEGGGDEEACRSVPRGRSVVRSVCRSRPPYSVAKQSTAAAAAAAADCQSLHKEYIKERLIFYRLFNCTQRRIDGYTLSEVKEKETPTWWVRERERERERERSTVLVLLLLLLDDDHDDDVDLSSSKRAWHGLVSLLYHTAYLSLAIKRRHNKVRSD